MVFRFYVTLHWWTWILIWLGLILLLLIAFPKWFFVDGRICFCFHHHESTNENEDINHAKIKEEKIKRLHDKLQQRILEKISPYTKVRSVGIFLLACIFASLTIELVSSSNNDHSSIETSKLEEETSSTDSEEVMMSTHQVMDCFPVTLPTTQERMIENNDDDDDVQDEENQSNDNKIDTTTIDLSSLQPITNKSDPNDEVDETLENTIDCSICMSSLVPGDKISWSAFDHCPHTFHHDCIVSWLTTLACNRIAENDSWKEDHGDIDYYFSNVTLTCPICRQEFLKVTNDNN